MGLDSTLAGDSLATTGTAGMVSDINAVLRQVHKGKSGLSLAVVTNVILAKASPRGLTNTSSKTKINNLALNGI